MLNRSVPPIYREAQKLVLLLESTVRGFSRYHKYTIGADLRRQAMAVLRLVHRATYDTAQQSAYVEKLVWAVDDVKLSLQAAKDMGVFSNFNQFEAVAVATASLGKQCGGWHRQCQARAGKVPTAATV